MNNAFPRLLKVLSLERQLGYRNKAVIGGLDKFASRWEVDARAEAPDAPQVGEIISLLIGYPAVEDTAARERIIEEILRRVREIAPTLTVSEERAAPPPQPRPAPPVASEPSPAAPDLAAQPEGSRWRQNRLVRSRAENEPASAFCRQSANRREPRRPARLHHRNRRRLNRRLRPLSRRPVRRSPRQCQRRNPQRQSPSARLLHRPRQARCLRSRPRPGRLLRQAPRRRHLPGLARPRSVSARP